ncbi:AMSH-like ubiquitin thioesterase 2 isoform X2 [Curcuma longa]|uniref:AMSH-like ubiquitin thioesterase 2 isoform X2 n=1 Tax=Curcuma longa TaxID=136217 RepID=UPI003D9F169E
MSVTMVPSVDDRFPVSFYFRIADQLLKQADVYRKEGNLDCLHLTLNRYVRLVSQVIPQHRNYSKHSSKEKLRHTKILQESSKEVEKLKLLATTNINSSGSQLGRRSKNNINNFRSTSQRWTKKILNFSSFKEGKIGHYDSRTCQRGDGNEVHVVKHYFPSSVVSWVEEGGSSGQVSHVIFPGSNDDNSKCISEGSSTSDSTKDMHISVKLTEEFLDLAKENTDRDLETCGILGAFLNHTFYITTLIIPKQESTSNSCQALNEEEIYAVLDERSLYPAGWIHTHPSQTCFLSSIDLHTQYSYQVMLPEAIAIVLAPTDPTKGCGIFRLTDPGGISVLKECNERDFHPHSTTADGSPIYEICSNIYTNSNLRFEIIDLRISPG